MIEVNLLPGGKKRSSRGGGFSLKLPKLSFGGGGGDAMDPYIIFFTVAAVIAVVYMGLMFVRSGSAREDLQVRIEEERQDSLRFAAVIDRTERLRAQGDSIQQRIEILREIDRNRFQWPHLMDEVAAAVPDFTWLNGIVQTSESPLTVRISGRAGSIYAVTNFMSRLELSDFLENVVLEGTQQVQAEDNSGDMVQSFELLVTYESPPLEDLQTVPLFEGESVSAQTAAPPAGN